MVMSGINDENREVSLELIKEMAVQMSSERDTDGLGYAALTKEGNLFGERWLNNKDAFKERMAVDERAEAFARSTGGMASSTLGNRYNSFGVGPAGLDQLVAVTLHTRLATCGREFCNVHPFVSEDGKTSLIHNGVISNHDKLKKVTSTNDSETILHLYTEYEVMDDLNAIQHVADKLYGYYACGVFSETAEGMKILDVFRDDRADLHGVFIKELGIPVITTKLEFIQKACANLDLTIVQIYKIKGNMMIRFEPYSGTVLDYCEFKSNGYQSYQSYPDTTDPDWWKPGYQKSSSNYTPPAPPEKSNLVSLPGKTEAEKEQESLERTNKFLKSLNKENLVRAVDKYLHRLLSREESGKIDGAILAKHLQRIHRHTEINDIMDVLCGEYGWDEKVDKETDTWFIYRRKSE
jgi:hypothetical protein